jgi:hypothetical protein
MYYYIDKTYGDKYQIFKIYSLSRGYIGLSFYALGDDWLFSFEFKDDVIELRDKIVYADYIENDTSYVEPEKTIFKNMSEVLNYIDNYDRH